MMVKCLIPLVRNDEQEQELKPSLKYFIPPKAGTLSNKRGTLSAAIIVEKLNT